MAAQMWFGTLYETNVPGTSDANQLSKMQWVACPDTGMGAGAEGYSEVLQFENGGADVVSSAATHRVYDMNWGTRSGSGTAGLDIIRSYQQKQFGSGLIYFCDPMAQNLFPPSWATPHLIMQGWKNISRGVPTLLPNTTNPTTQPRAGTSFDMTDVPSTAPSEASHFAVIPIPPTHTLRVGFTGTATAAASIRVRPINTSGVYQSTVTATLLGVSSGQITNLSYSGASFSAIEVWVAGSGLGTIGSLTLYSAHAELVPNTNPGPTTLSGSYAPGAGNTGCKFTSAAIVENYVMLDRTLKGMSTQLTEVGAWQRAGT